MSKRDAVWELLGLYRIYALCFGGIAVVPFWAYVFFLDVESAVEFWLVTAGIGIGLAGFIISMIRWWQLIQEMEHL